MITAVSPSAGGGLEKQEEPGRKLPVSSPPPTGARERAGGERGEIQSRDIQDGNLALGGIDGIRPGTL